MLRAKFTEAHLFKRVVTLTQSMVGATTMQISQEGLSFGGIDAAGGMLSDIRIGRKAFESYHCTRGFGIDVDFPSLAEDLRCIGALHTLEISVQANANHLVLFGNKDGAGVQVRIEVALLQIQGDKLVIQEVDYIAVARMQCTLSLQSRVCNALCSEMQSRASRGMGNK